MHLMIAGLGLIGGSLALALHPFPGLTLTAIEPDPLTRGEALRLGAVSACWEDAQSAPVEEADMLILCQHPRQAVDFVNAHGLRMKRGSCLSDVCGIKTPLYQAISSLDTPPFAYIGGHPMAGRERGGFANATADLFRGSHYILVPGPAPAPEAERLLRALMTYAGVADFIVATPQEHDERIAYTSQLMHVLALALCDQHLLSVSQGFEGGSFRGATRVAALDPQLWTDLFWDNRQALCSQISELQEKLDTYRQLLEGDSQEALTRQLTLSSDRKKAFDQVSQLPLTRSPLFR